MLHGPRGGGRGESLDFTRGEKLTMLRTVLFQSVRQPSQTASQPGGRKGAGPGFTGVRGMRRRRKVKKAKTQKAAPLSALKKEPTPRDEVSPPLAPRTRLVSQRRGGPDPKGQAKKTLGNGTGTGIPSLSMIPLLPAEREHCPKMPTAVAGKKKKKNRAKLTKRTRKTKQAQREDARPETSVGRYCNTGRDMLEARTLEIRRQEISITAFEGSLWKDLGLRNGGRRLKKKTKRRRRRRNDDSPPPPPPPLSSPDEQLCSDLSLSLRTTAVSAGGPSVEDEDPWSQLLALAETAASDSFVANVVAGSELGRQLLFPSSLTHGNYRRGSAQSTADADTTTGWEQYRYGRGGGGITGTDADGLPVLSDSGEDQEDDYVRLRGSTPENNESHTGGEQGTRRVVGGDENKGGYYYTYPQGDKEDDYVYGSALPPCCPNTHDGDGVRHTRGVGEPSSCGGAEGGVGVTPVSGPVRALLLMALVLKSQNIKCQRLAWDRLSNTTGDAVASSCVLYEAGVVPRAEAVQVLQLWWRRITPTAPTPATRKRQNPPSSQYHDDVLDRVGQDTGRDYNWARRVHGRAVVYDACEQLQSWWRGCVGRGNWPGWVMAKVHRQICTVLSPLLNSICDEDAMVERGGRLLHHRRGAIARVQDGGKGALLDGVDEASSAPLPHLQHSQPPPHTNIESRGQHAPTVAAQQGLSRALRSRIADWRKRRLARKMCREAEEHLFDFTGLDFAIRNRAAHVTAVADDKAKDNEKRWGYLYTSKGTPGKKAAAAIRAAEASTSLDACPHTLRGHSRKGPNVFHWPATEGDASPVREVQKKHAHMCRLLRKSRHLMMRTEAAETSEVDASKTDMCVCTWRKWGGSSGESGGTEMQRPACTCFVSRLGLPPTRKTDEDEESSSSSEEGSFESDWADASDSGSEIDMPLPVADQQRTASQARTRAPIPTAVPKVRCGLCRGAVFSVHLPKNAPFVACGTSTDRTTPTTAAVTGSCGRTFHPYCALLESVLWEESKGQLFAPPECRRMVQSPLPPIAKPPFHGQTCKLKITLSGDEGEGNQTREHDVHPGTSGRFAARHDDRWWCTKCRHEGNVGIRLSQNVQKAQEDEGKRSPLIMRRQSLTWKKEGTNEWPGEETGEGERAKGGKEKEAAKKDAVDGEEINEEEINEEGVVNAGSGGPAVSSNRSSPQSSQARVTLWVLFQALDVKASGRVLRTRLYDALRRDAAVFRLVTTSELLSPLLLPCDASLSMMSALAPHTPHDTPRVDDSDDAIWVPATRTRTESLISTAKQTRWSPLHHVHGRSCFSMQNSTTTVGPMPPPPRCAISTCNFDGRLPLPRFNNPLGAEESGRFSQRLRKALADQRDERKRERDGEATVPTNRTTLDASKLTVMDDDEEAPWTFRGYAPLHGRGGKEPTRGLPGGLIGGAAIAAALRAVQLHTTAGEKRREMVTAAKWWFAATKRKARREGKKARVCMTAAARRAGREITERDEHGYLLSGADAARRYGRRAREIAKVDKCLAVSNRERHRITPAVLGAVQRFKRSVERTRRGAKPALIGVARHVKATADRSRRHMHDRVVLVRRRAVPFAAHAARRAKQTIVRLKRHAAPIVLPLMARVARRSRPLTIRLNRHVKPVAIRVARRLRPLARSAALTITAVVAARAGIPAVSKALSQSVRWGYRHTRDCINKRRRGPIQEAYAYPARLANTDEGPPPLSSCSDESTTVDSSSEISSSGFSGPSYRSYYDDDGTEDNDDNHGIVESDNTDNNSDRVSSSSSSDGVSNGARLGPGGEKRTREEDLSSFSFVEFVEFMSRWAHRARCEEMQQWRQRRSDQGVVMFADSDMSSSRFESTMPGGDSSGHGGKEENEEEEEDSRSKPEEKKETEETNGDAIENATLAKPLARSSWCDTEVVPRAASSRGGGHSGAYMDLLDVATALTRHSHANGEDGESRKGSDHAGGAGEDKAQLSIEMRCLQNMYGQHLWTRSGKEDISIVAGIGDRHNTSTNKFYASTPVTSASIERGGTRRVLPPLPSAAMLLLGGDVFNEPVIASLRQKVLEERTDGRRENVDYQALGDQVHW